VKASELVGHMAFRTTRVKSGDGSYTTSPIKILKVTDHHIYHKCNDEGKVRLLNDEWLDDNWIKWVNPEKFVR